MGKGIKEYNAAWSKFSAQIRESPLFGLSQFEFSSALVEFI